MAILYKQDLAGCLTPEEYEQAIPSCCFFQGYEGHVHGMLLCWSLTSSIDKGVKVDCTGCELNKENMK